MHTMGIAATDLARESDTALVARARAGDREAFGRLVARHQAAVSAVTYSGIGDLGLSEDLAQETFLAAWRSLGELREPEKLRAWLCGIARNLARNAFRRRTADEPLEGAAEVRAPGPTPLEHTIAREEASQLARALADIPETYREPLVLFYRDGQSVAGVAAALALSEDAVKQRLARGRQLLREEVTATVERTLARTVPGRAFTVAVIAALPALVPGVAVAGVTAAAAKGSAAAQAGAAASLAAVAVGPLLGIAGAWIGARASIENTRSPRERRFMKRMAWVAGIYVLGFLAVEAVLAAAFPDVWASLYGQLTLWSLYVAGLFELIRRGNRRQHEIQVEDGTVPPPQPLTQQDPASSRAAIYGSLGGGVFGAVCWLFPMSLIARDWLPAALAAVVAAAAFTIGARRAVADPARYPRIARAVFVALGLLNLVLVNLRWEAWMVAFRQSPFAATSVELPLWAMNVLLVGVIVLVLIRIRDLEPQG